ncbi:MAG: FimV family protein, partial [Gammaproteobacteria bacterium]
MELKKITRTILIFLLMAPLSCFATGLGDIQVQSSLNQPFDATIPVVDIGNVPPDAVTAGLASEKQFETIGLEKDPNLSILQFAVERNKQQQTVISVYSTQPVTQPVLTFLLQLNWPGGQIMREYTVFLDPSNYTPASAKPKPIQQPAVSQTSYASSSTPAKPATYGPTTTQDNLWEIASQNVPNSQLTAEQTMVAIIKLNPHAFTMSNINGLKSGYILKLPNATQVSAISAVDAQTLIEQQNAAWQSHAQTTVLPQTTLPTTPENKTTQTITSTESTMEPTIPSAPMPSELSAPMGQQPQGMPIEQHPPATTNAPLIPVTSIGQESDAITNQSGSTPEVQALENEVTVSTEAMKATTTANQSLQQAVSTLESQVKV